MKKNKFLLKIFVGTVAFLTMPSALSVQQLPLSKLNMTVSANESTYIWNGAVDTSWYRNEETVFHITSAEQLAGLQELVNAGKTFAGKSVYLDSDIFINADADYENWISTEPDNIWTGIGSSAYPFNGTFDGQNHSVYGLYSISSGLFGVVQNAVIKNIDVQHSVMSSKNDIGMICSKAINSKISNCDVSGYIDASASGTNVANVGGICGYLQYGTITNCNNYCQFTSTGNVITGGICGTASPADSAVVFQIMDCNNYGQITAEGISSYAGGILGYSPFNISVAAESIIARCSNFGEINANDAGGICGRYYFQREDFTGRIRRLVISNCANSGMVCGVNAGGLLGYSYTPVVSMIPCIENSYNVGKIVGTTKGSLVGYERQVTTRINCFYLPEISDKGGIAKTQAQFASGEVAYLLNNSSDSGIWKQEIGKDAYPVLTTTDNNTVYQYKNCQNKVVYTNDETFAGITGRHDFSVEDTAAENALFSEADCVTPAQYYKSCSLCGEISTNQEDIFAFGEPLGHDMTEIPAKEPTLTESGNYQYWICSHEDGVYYKDSEGKERFENLEDTVIPSMGKRLDIAFGHNVALNNNLGIIYYVPADKLDGFENVRLVLQKEQFNADGSECNLKEEVLSSYKIEDSGYGDEYVFSYRNIAAKEMNSKVYASLYAEKDGITYISPVDEYSIAIYANNKLEKSSTKTELKTLLVDMLNYGATAQTYFNYNTGNLANSSLTLEQQELGTNADTLSIGSAAAETKISSPKATFSGKNLLLGNNVAIVYYMTFDNSVNKNDVTLELTYQTVTGTIVTKCVPFKDFVKGEYTGEYRYDFSEIKAKDSCQPVTAVLYQNEEQISNALTYSVETYAYNKLNNNATNSNLREIINAMMVYCKSAEKYFST